MIKKGLLIGLMLYVAFMLGGMLFSACSKSSDNDDRNKLLLLFFLSQPKSYFVSIPEGMAH